MIRLKELTKDQLCFWDEIATESKTSTIFHTIDWMKMLKKIYNDISLSFLGIFKNQELIGIMPCYLEHKKRFKFLFSPIERATPYGGPIFKNKVPEGFFKELNEYFRKNCISKAYITFSPSFKFKKKELFLKTVRYTYLLDLQKDKEVLWTNLNKKCRNSTRKAQKSGITVTEISDKLFLEEFYKMSLSTFSKTNIELALPLNYYQALWDSFYPKNLKILAAYLNEKPIAAAIFLLFRDEIYYWHGVSYREYNRLCPNNLIQWELICWGSKNYKKYNLLGANIPSIAKFKAGFGGELVPYYHGTKIYSKLYSLSNIATRFFRKAKKLIKSK